jgi:hypothetical protein
MQRVDDYIMLTRQKGKQLTSATRQEISLEDRETLMVKKAWELALAPLKALPMSAIMTYFSGSSLQIFSVTMTASLFWTPLKVLASSPTEIFNPLDTPGTHARLSMPKLVFIIGQLLSIVLGMIKLQYMGLLPTTTSDWLAFQHYEPVSIHNSGPALTTSHANGLHIFHKSFLATDQSSCHRDASPCLASTYSVSPPTPQSHGTDSC